jgi:nucleoside-diphosphate-sugar epimerase
MTTTPRVLVFGAAGDVGSAAALQAHQESAKVFLAVRNIAKSIPNLDNISLEKIQADLTKPETVTAAVNETGAKVVFIYAVFGTDDGMRPSLLALKEAGVESVVLLSSFTVAGNPREVSPTDFIAWHHAQVEIALEDIFGVEKFTAIRPAYFASNIFQHKRGIRKGLVELPNPEAEFDWISPSDIGRVCGTILAHGTAQHIVGLVGAEKMALKDAIAVISGILGTQVEVHKIGADQALQNMLRTGVPPPVASWMIHDVMQNAGASFRATGFEEAVGNIQKYTGKHPVKFQHWVEDNKNKFQE